MNDRDCILLYREAIACLAVASLECTKTTNVDITMMLSNISQGASLLEELKAKDHDIVRQMGIEQVQEMLSYQQEALSAKIKQLDSLPHKEILQSPNDINNDSKSASRKTLHEADMDDADSDISNRKRRRRDAIQNTIVKEKKLTFADVAGLAQAKEALKEAIIMPLQYPHLFTGGREPWRRILLYGPPGTGKSRLAQSLASEIGSTFYCVSSSDLVSSWVGESEKLIKELFQHATGDQGRSVIFIDEIDSLCRQRSSGEEEHTRRVKNELLFQMEGTMRTGVRDQVFLLAATNCPWELDVGFLRRFQKRIYIPLPNREARHTLVKLHLKGTTATLTADEWDELTLQTEGYSGSDLSNLVIGALFEPIRHLQRATHWLYTTDGKLLPCSPGDLGAFSAELTSLPPDQVTPREMKLEDFLVSLKQHQNTVTAHDLEKFEEFTKNFGQNG